MFLAPISAHLTAALDGKKEAFRGHSPFMVLLISLLNMERANENSDF